MNRVLLMAVTFFFLASCGNSQNSNNQTSAKSETQAQVSDPSVVNVYYFHGKQRCKTCITVGEIAEKTIKDNYKDNNKVKFIDVDASDKKNNALAEKYSVAGNGLVIAKGDNSINIVEQAFATALNNPDALRELIKKEINNRL